MVRPSVYGCAGGRDMEKAKDSEIEEGIHAKRTG